jgi:hypothetical protein
MEYLKQLRGRSSWQYWLAAGVVAAVLMYAAWAMSR